MSLSSVTNMGVWATTTDAEEDKFFAALAKSRERLVQFDADLLHLSCALYRLRKTTKDNDWNRALSDVPAKEITAADIELADSIRSHFNNKLMLARLRGNELTKFRTDLSKFLNGTFTIKSEFAAKLGFEYPENYVGLVYKLPYFYEYDQDIYDIFGGDYVSLKGKFTRDGEKKLTFLKRLSAYKKNIRADEYWFADEDSNRVVFTVERNNPLKELFESVLSSGIKIQAKYDHRMKDTLNYINAIEWKIVA